MSLRRILGHRWHEYISNNLVLREAGLRHVTCIVRERQLRLYGHVARLPTEDPSHRILFVGIRGAGPCRELAMPRGWTLPRGWSMPRGRPHASWLRQAESYLNNMGMTGTATAWTMGGELVDFYIWTGNVIRTFERYSIRRSYWESWQRFLQLIETLQIDVTEYSHISQPNSTCSIAVQQSLDRWNHYDIRLNRLMTPRHVTVWCHFRPMTSLPYGRNRWFLKSSSFEL